MLSLYLSHPQVEMDPAIDVSQWTLSAIGRRRAEALSQRLKLDRATRLCSSAERKAMDLAQILAASTDQRVTYGEAFNENDRSATGFLPKEEFEAAANRFFGEPENSYAGWERAIDAQARIVRAVDEVLSEADGPVVFCGHGAVGTLLKCHVAKRAINRSEDQSHSGDPGGGNGLIFDWATGVLIGDWTPFEALPSNWQDLSIA
ncbi:histidine phosphatase family protein [Devosia rhodophyticola]|uniref:Histidine phosphatase family protein n=1 Tax=Devosia rhodophyticola TaxID=3026423 RepID=A0ABY7Z118_9HYPH|nr:histidine phosphatase family protein [Devosia rhodophyticola]WDR07355.1 histidine phosphatase family protein [Devosia rhodophyticola]